MSEVEVLQYQNLSSEDQVHLDRLQELRDRGMAYRMLKQLPEYQDLILNQYLDKGLKDLESRQLQALDNGEEKEYVTAHNEWLGRKRFQRYLEDIEKQAEDAERGLTELEKLKIDQGE